MTGLLPLSVGRWSSFTDHFFPQNQDAISFDQSQVCCARKSTSLPCISSLQAAIHVPVATQPDLLNSAPAEVCLFCIPNFSAVSSFLVTLSPPVAGALLSRLPKIMFPTEYSRLCVVWRSVPFHLPVTAQARITLAFIHIFFNCIACSYLICNPLRHFQHDCLVSSSFLPNIFGLDYIYLLMENFNLPWDSI